MQPTVSVNRFSGGFRIIEIAEHDVVATADDFTGFATRKFVVVLVDDANFSIGNCTPRRKRNGFGIVFRTTHRDGAGCFGQTVGSDDVFKCELVTHALDHRDRNCRSSGHSNT
ncbi:unannotated protein [freshwater metagenome]|uniref:Unannotated protein n=1 Tax=freshwater metagenome TaxID=449393 RepID=A0A6J6EVB3_9ZZZZ